MPTTRGSTASPRSTATIRGSPVSTVSSGTIALPIPAATSPCTVWLSFDRKAHRGSTPRSAERRLDRVSRQVGAEADEGLAGDLPERRGARGERRAGRHDEHVRVAQELDRLEGRVTDRRQQEADVELAALQRPNDHLVVVLLQHDLDQRPLSGEAAHDLRQDAGPRGLKVPTRSVPASPAAAPADRPARPGVARRSNPHGEAAADPPRSGRRPVARPAARPASRRRSAPGSRSAG